jgi:hypothetical protein
MPSEEAVMMLREYGGPLYAAADTSLHPHRVHSVGFWPADDEGPRRLDHVTIMAGEAVHGPWVSVTTNMRPSGRLRPESRARFYLRFALIIEGGILKGSDGDDRDDSFARWSSVVQAAHPVAGELCVGGRLERSSALEVIGDDVGQLPALFAESVELNEVEVVVWGHVSARPTSLQTVDPIDSYLTRPS